MQFAFEVAVVSIFGELESNLKEKLRENYFTLDKGYNSFAVNLPGTSYRGALLVRIRQLPLAYASLHTLYYVCIYIVRISLSFIRKTESKT